MGQTLATPVIEKHSSNGADELYIYGISDMQGWRISMEDAHAAVLQLTEGSGQDQVSVFAVYDGHGGENVALFTGERLHRIVADEEAFKKKDYVAALKSGFLATDRAILADRKLLDDPSGCTATVNLLTGDGKIYCANAGDSRTVLGSKGHAKPLSQDHKPQNEEEKERICAAGGFVDFGRVNGNLALSRAIGDFEFKKNKDLPAERQIVTADPDVSTHTIDGDDEFLVVACDGIWDCKSSQQVIEFVRRGIVAGQELHVICENLMDNCLASSSDGGGVGCDNMTVMVIGLLQGKSKEDWYKMIQDRVANNEGPCAPESAAELKPPQFEQFQQSEIHYGSYKVQAEEDEDEQDEDEAEDEEDAEDKDAQQDGKQKGSIVVLKDGSELLRQKDEKSKIEESEASEREEAAKETQTDEDKMDTK